MKGGHRHDRADDVLGTAEGDVVWLRAPRVDTENAHGTGCTLSSAIACGLAKGLPMEEAVRAAKDYVRGALAAGLNLGKGSGPLDHMWEYSGPAALRPPEHADAAAAHGTRSRGDAEGSRTEVRFTLAIPTISGTMAALADLLRRPARPFRA